MIAGTLGFLEEPADEALEDHGEDFVAVDVDSSATYLDGEGPRRIEEFPALPKPVVRAPAEFREVGA